MGDERDTAKTLLAGDIRNLEALFRGQCFLPAAVQRDYQWGVSECAALLADFERAWRADNSALQVNANGQCYFLGSFVFRPQNSAEGCEVFDGLQRLTTLTVLFAVMRDLVVDLDARCHQMLVAVIHDQSGRPRLRLRGEDQTLASLIQTNSEAVRRRRNLSGNTLRARLLSAAGFFRNRLSELSDVQIVDFANFILSKVFVCVIEVSEEALARQIFITTNNRGVPLNEPDVLKSQINSIPHRQDTADHVLGIWDTVKASFTDDAKYALFLYAIDFRSRRKGRGAEGLTALGEYLGQELNDDAILAWMTDYQEAAKVWHWIDAVKTDPIRNDPTRGALHRLFCFDWVEWHAVALEIASTYLAARNDRDKRRQRTAIARFQALEKVCLMMTILETPEFDRVRIMSRALSDLSAGRNLMSGAFESIVLQINEVEAILKGPVFDLKLATQCLRWWETLEAKKRDRKFADYQVRRVLPLHVEEFSQWEALFPNRDDRWTSAHAWGNLVLLPQFGDLQQDFDDFKSLKKSLSQQKLAGHGVASVLKKTTWTPEVIVQRSDKFRDCVIKYLSS